MLLSEHIDVLPKGVANMKILVVGGGGREHAIIKKIKENNAVETIYALPGNGGIAKDAVCVDIKATDLEAVRDFAINEKIDFAIVAPDDPLVLGMVDELEGKGIPCFGPSKRAAIIEGSKAFSKDLMRNFNIPTAKYEVFDNPAKAKAYIDEHHAPIVIKADGLALGKGVIIAETDVEAKDAIDKIMTEKAFGESGNKVVIEEFLEGPEVSVLAFTDGKTIVPMISSMDHKRALDGDKGLNTGGMGVIAPNPYYTPEIAKESMERIFKPTMEAMNSLDRTFKGCLYFGLMITKDGPKVIEYNCRFGDPEAQAVLPLLETDLLEIMMDVRNEKLTADKVKFSEDSTCCLILASKGYPQSYEKGFPISFNCDTKDIFIAGAKIANYKLVTSGGRVLGITKRADSLKEAIDLAYKAADDVSFDNKYYRNDIGHRALEILEEVK